MDRDPCPGGDGLGDVLGGHHRNHRLGLGFLESLQLLHEFFAFVAEARSQFVILFGHRGLFLFLKPGNFRQKLAGLRRKLCSL
jgi:hypothetical protein